MFFKDTNFLKDQAHHTSYASAIAHFCTSNDRASGSGPLSEQPNAEMRNQQNSMIFGNQIEEITLVCAQAFL